jgi:hypothetical protein
MRDVAAGSFCDTVAIGRDKDRDPFCRIFDGPVLYGTAQRNNSVRKS